jgi:uncharacterized protein (DUF1330 family)
MAAYVFANIRQITDQGAYDEYRAQVLATITRYDGRFLARAGRAEVLEGDAEAGRVVVIEFPSYEQAKAWYDSDEYRPLVELRQRASDGELILVDGV